MPRLIFYKISSTDPHLHCVMGPSLSLNMYILPGLEHAQTHPPGRKLTFYQRATDAIHFQVFMFYLPHAHIHVLADIFKSFWRTFCKENPCIKYKYHEVTWAWTCVAYDRKLTLYQWAMEAIWSLEDFCLYIWRIFNTSLKLSKNCYQQKNEKF
jgi:hypothetical protein